MALVELPQSVEHLNEYLNCDEFYHELNSHRAPRILFDIETGPAPDELLQSLFQNVEVKLPAYPGIFDPGSVRYGQMKDPVKREAKLQECQTKHQIALDVYDQECQKTQDEAWSKFIQESTLHAESCQVIAVGYGIIIKGDVEVLLDIDPIHEELLLDTFWTIERLVKRRGGQMISFNGNRFDIPILTRRSWVKQQEPPYVLTKYRKLEDHFVDAKEHWQIGGGWGETIKLDTLAQVLGVTRKLQGMTGALFHSTLRNDPPKARQYLAHDIYSLGEVAQRMGLLS